MAKLYERFAQDPDRYDDDEAPGVIEAQVHVMRQLGVRAGLEIEKLIWSRHDFDPLQAGH